MTHELHIPASVGEVIDKITILEIKQNRIADPIKLDNINAELDALRSVLLNQGAALPDMLTLTAELLRVNTAIWIIEDNIRECERKKNFGPQFVELARSVYINNDERSRIKRQINELAGSFIVEEKSYETY